MPGRRANPAAQADTVPREPLAGRLSRETVGPPIPAPEAFHEPPGRNRLSGGLLHERGRLELPPVGMHTLPQPGEQAPKAACGEVAI